MTRIFRNAADRRNFLRNTIGLGLMSLYDGPNMLFGATGTPVKRQRKPDTRFLIVMQGSGGASIIDSALAIHEAEVTAAGGDATTLNCFSAAQMVAIDGTPLRAVNYKGTIASLGNFEVTGDQATFLHKHYQDMLAVTLQGTSITHGTAQKRSITGNEAWAGRTLQEICAKITGRICRRLICCLARVGLSTQGSTLACRAMLAACR